MCGLKNIFTVCFFGHREVDNYQLAESKTYEIVADLIRSKEYVDFLVGRNGEFDQIVSSAVKKAQRNVFHAREGFQAGDRVHLGFRAEYARRVFEGEKEVQNDFWAEVEDVLYLGSHQELLVRTEGGNQWRILEFAPGENDPQPGEGIKIGAKMRFSVRSFLVFRAE